MSRSSTGRAGRDRLGVRELELGGLVLDELGGRALGLDVLVAEQADDDLGVPGVGEEGAQGDADVALVVEQEELDPLGVVEGALRPRARPRAARGSCWRRRNGPRTRATRALRPRGLAAARRPRCCSVGLPSGLATRASSNSSAVSGVMTPWVCPLVDERLVEGLELGDALRGEQLGHRVALVHRDHREHRLAAEEVLVGDAVLVDLIGLVEVAVLARRELELGDAEAEDDGHDHDHDGHDDGVLAELDRQPRPEALHAVPPRDGPGRPFGTPSR